MNPQTLEQALSPVVQNSPFYPLDIRIFQQLPSTNQTLWEWVEQGAKPGTVAIALTQNSGKGQWGRQWQSSPGGVYLSFFLTPDLAPENSLLLTLCSAWGIAQSLRQSQPEVPVQLKWPNDLVLEGRKLGGILTETRLSQGKITKAVIGVGLNWTNPVPETGISLASWFEENDIQSTWNLETVSAIALEGIISGYQYAMQKGIDSLRSGCEQLLIHLGHPVTVNGSPGIIIGISPTGQLRVRLEPTNFQTSSEIDLNPGTISLGYIK
ncbi:biotin--[acetyl-CoA-carboxylase] ligase [Kamptonema cortianum]|nr:biotin--[acetyl-CoA-carboxylase] ligase [Kamptonema cortianum]